MEQVTAVKWTHQRGECGPHCGMTVSPQEWLCDNADHSSGEWDQSPASVPWWNAGDQHVQDGGRCYHTHTGASASCCHRQIQLLHPETQRCTCNNEVTSVMSLHIKRKTLVSECNTVGNTSFCCTAYYKQKCLSWRQVHIQNLGISMMQMKSQRFTIQHTWKRL